MAACLHPTDDRPTPSLRQRRVVTNQMAFSPHPGSQTAFLESQADIVIYGGGPGAGKTVALLLGAGRAAAGGEHPVVFCRLASQVTGPGGLRDRSEDMYRQLGGTREARGWNWRWPSGGLLRLHALPKPETTHNWSGSELSFIGFDQLEHFESYQFWYMLSRNRNVGVRPRMRATVDDDWSEQLNRRSWVGELIAWWIDQDTGDPISGRVGALRYFVRIGDRMVWASEPDELLQYMPAPPPGVGTPRPQSLTFIPGLWPLQLRV